MKKLWLLIIPLAAAVAIFGYTTRVSKPAITPSNQIDQPKQEEPKSKAGACQVEAITIEGYTDKGKKLANCFVEYPGEPSRQDKSYYIVEDICGQFTKEFVQNALGKPVVKTEKPKMGTLSNCTYYVNDKDYVMLVLDYLKFDNQKIGQEAMGRKTEISSKIPMRNMLVWQENGLLNSLYLVLGDNKFISIQRTSSLELSSDELISFAANLASQIKNYK